MHTVGLYWYTSSICRIEDSSTLCMLAGTFENYFCSVNCLPQKTLIKHFNPCLDL